MNQDNRIRNLQKKIRYNRSQHNKYHKSDPKTARMYFDKIQELKKQLQDIKCPTPIQQYKENKRNGIVTPKPKFKKHKIDHSVEFRKRKIERNMPLIIKNAVYKYMNEEYKKNCDLYLKNYEKQKLNIMFKLAKVM
tara:strand:+ start:366 stop:773 length:408 start_codon:yes stop_codon:yes gene_type:complete